MAIQFIPLVAAIVGGAVTVGAGTYAYKNYQKSQEQPEPVALSQPSQKPVIAPTPRPETTAKPEVAKEQIILPKFHLLRAENDGSVVIAGSAPPLSKVDILHGENVLAESKAASNGDFAIIFDDPLKPGTYELFIRSTLDGKLLLSAEAGIVRVPEQGEEVIAMVSEPGAASKLIQVPPAPKEKTQVKPEQPKIVAKPEGKKQNKTVAKIVKKIENITTDVKPIDPPKPAVVEKASPPKPAPIIPVLLGAVEVEGGKLFIAGTGEPGRVVNLYMDDKFVGEAKVSPQGSFLLESNTELAVGNHTVRADMLATKNAVVVARAQVPLIHDAPVVEAPKVAQVVETPKVAETPKVVEPPKVVIEEKPIVVAKAPEPVETVAPVEEQQPARNLGAVEIEKPKPVAIAKPKVKVVTAKPTRVIRTGSSVIIRRGDNLWRVSRRILGRGIRYSTIYNANRSQIKNPSLIFPGQIFKIPERMVESNSDQNG